MDRQTPLPANWDLFLDEVQSNLARFLEQAQEREDSQRSDSSCATLPLADGMRRIHQGMDDRLGQLEVRLKDLDQSVALVESQAQDLHQSARHLREQRSGLGSCPASTLAP